MRRFVFVGVLLSTVVALGAQPRRPPWAPDPARNAVRVELRLTTDARFASVRVLGEQFGVARGRRLAGPADLRTAVLENLLAMSGNVEGETASGAFRLVLTEVDPGSAVSWLLNVQAGHRATVDVFDLNDESRPHLVDRFDGVVGDTFRTSANQLRVGGPLPRPRSRQRMVLAHYYPWYERATWADPRLIDQPLHTYSTDDPADVRRNLEDAARAGLDGVIFAWPGQEWREDWNSRRLQLVLQAAQQLGLRVSVQSQPRLLDAAGRDVPPDADTLARWLDEIDNALGTHPAFLRVDGRPVVFAYAWPYASDATWRAALDRLRAKGQNPYVIADTIDPSAYEIVDATSTYAANIFAPDIEQFTRRATLDSRTFHLLGEAYGPPRVSVVTVSPGYDERSLPDRLNRLFVDRENGAFYVRQWRAAIDNYPDWVVITTWNEWWENTHIEGSQRYGELYPAYTKYWAGRFKDSPRP